MLAVLPLILGVQVLLQALVLDVQNVPRQTQPACTRKAPVVWAEHDAEPAARDS